MTDTDWPYDFQAAEERLDLSEIRKQGLFFLKRSLNIDRLIAFVGVGSSMAYGRVSWGELGSVQVSQIIDVYETLYPNALRDRPQPPPSTISPLVEQLHALQDSVNSEDGDTITLAMQIAEQVWTLSNENELNELKNRFGLSKDVATSGRELFGKSKDAPAPGHRLFRKSIMLETIDATSHIKRILSNPFKDSGSDPIGDWASTIDAPTLDRFPTVPANLDRLFTTKAIGAIAAAAKIISAEVRDDAKASACELDAALLAAEIADLMVSAAHRARPASGIQPVRYYSLGLVFDLYRFALPDHKRKDHLVSIVTLLKEHCNDSPELLRAKLIPPDDDPLWILFERLGIRRFITTNYDLEIERMFAHAGFSPTDYSAQAHLEGEDIERIGNMGGRSREIVLRESSAADFIDFAAGSGFYLAQVAHIHGRATDGDEVVVTDKDYQHTYVGERPEQKLQISAREGFEILFGGNPVLFVGLSLAEGDVMRPLREFASQNIRRNNSVIALREATETAAKRDAFTLQQYVRHRVYVIHYGFRGDGACWLEAFQLYFKQLETFIGIARDASSTPDGLNKHQKEIHDRGLALAKAVGMKSWTAAEIDHEFDSDNDTCRIGFELAFVYGIQTFIFNALSSDLYKNPKADDLLKVTLLRALKRARNGVITAALNARLRGLMTEWQDWSGSWLGESPRHRVANRHFASGRTAPVHPDDLRYLDESTRPTQEDLSSAQYRNNVQALYKARWYRQLFEEPRTVADITQAEFDLILTDFLRSQAGPLSNARVFLVSGPRGAGKGAFFFELSRYGDFLLQPGESVQDLKRRPERRYAGQFIASLSFSSEIASVWDALIDFLIDPTQTTSEATDSAELTEKVGRIERMRTALLGAKRAAEGARTKIMSEAVEGRQILDVAPRFLIVLHAFDLLFERDGYPKNAEIRLLCDLFLENENVPVDFVLICREDKIPLYFRKDSSKQIRKSRRQKCRRKVLTLISDPPIDRNARRSVAVQASIDRSDLYVDGTGPARFLAYILPYWTAKPATAAKLPGPVKNSRFLATIYLLVECDIRARSHGEVDVDSFRRRVEQSRSSRGRSSSDDVIDRILRYWAERVPDLTADGALTLHSLGVSSTVALADPDVAAASDFGLQELLIRHLAVISVPVDAAVLAVCPQVRKRVSTLLDVGRKPPTSPPDARKLRVIQLALAILASRGLAFRFFTPSLAVGSQRTAEDPLPQRYQVHRLLQLYIYRRMGSQNIEPADAYFFSVSIYTSQTRELPTLGANGYAFLNDLIDGLIGYPRSEPGAVDTTAITTAIGARRLRAAIGLARTLFSIGVVARFANLKEVRIPHPPRVGYFEHHRLALRWMLLLAKKLDKAAAKQAGTYLPPFYRDEILWLYNEAGVFSLAQGQCDDAAALFSAALTQARKIEGPKNSPIRRRILINLASCEINRGRLARARDQLSEVVRSAEEDEIIRTIAEGYFGLIDHIEGSLVEANDQYDRAIKTLRELGRSRPVSIFLCCRAELHRHRNDHNLAEADLRDAVDIARRAGYEDTAWFAMVSKARMDATRNDARAFRKISEDLAKAEDYVEAMDIPYLRCEISYARAIILLKQGEYILAGQQATRAIRTATLNGLSLRALAYRNLLAEIHLERGWEEQAERMKTHVREAARSIGYRLLLQRMTKAE